MEENKDLCNIAENFTREIKHILIYDSEALSFNQNLRGQYPNPKSYLLKIDVHNIGDYKRLFNLKKQNKNDYFKIDISIPFLDLSFENRDKLYKFNKNRAYLIVTVSNKEMMVLGNDRERLSVDIFDHIQDNGKGKDQFTIKITGETIIYPTMRNVTDAFRVLLFSYPFA